MKFTENHSRPVKRRSDDSKIDERVALFSLKQLLSANYFFCFFFTLRVMDEFIKTKLKNLNFILKTSQNF